jgi:hypothetical protein
MTNTDYLFDENLSWGAKGLLATMYALPKGWSINKAYFYNNFNGSKGKVERLFAELEELGYLKVVRDNARHHQYVLKSSVDYKPNLDQNKPLTLKNSSVDYDTSSVENEPNLDRNRSLDIKYSNNNPYSPLFPEEEVVKSSRKKDEVYESLKRWYKSDEGLKDAVEDWYSHRKQQKDELTPRSKKMFLKRLEGLSHRKVGLAIKLIEKAILANWKNVYELKGDDLLAENNQIIKKPTNRL